jgi:hypothetical protein
MNGQKTNMDAVNCSDYTASNYMTISTVYLKKIRVSNRYFRWQIISDWHGPTICSAHVRINLIYFHSKWCIYFAYRLRPYHKLTVGSINFLHVSPCHYFPWSRNGVDARGELPAIDWVQMVRNRFFLPLWDTFEWPQNFRSPVSSLRNNGKFDCFTRFFWSSRHNQFYMYKLLFFIGQ